MSAHFSKGQKVVAILNHEPDSPGELKFEIGDVIKIIDAQKPGWLCGKFQNNTGWFPTKYVELYNENEESSNLLNQKLDYSQIVSTIINQDNTSNPTKLASLPVQEASDSNNSKDEYVPKTWSSSYPQIAKTISPQKIKQQEVIFELYNTEKDYVADLELIVDVFKHGMVKKNICSSADVQEIFSNIEEIYAVNRIFLSRLESKYKESPIVTGVGHICLEICHYFKMYSLYCANHNNSVTKLDQIRGRSFNKFMEECFPSDENSGVDLDFYLIKPIQRVCRYPLLIKALLKVTEADSPERLSLEDTYNKLDAIVAIINEGSKKTENVEKILEIQSRLAGKLSIISPSRTLIKEGKCTFIDDSRKQRNIYLFNDVLLFTKSSKLNSKESAVNKIPLVHIFKVVQVGQVTVKHVNDDEEEVDEAKIMFVLENWKFLIIILNGSCWMNILTSTINTEDKEHLVNEETLVVPEHISRQISDKQKKASKKNKEDKSETKSDLDQTPSKNADNENLQYNGPLSHNLPRIPAFSDAISDKPMDPNELQHFKSMLRKTKQRDQNSQSPATSSSSQLYTEVLQRMRKVDVTIGAWDSKIPPPPKIVSVPSKQSPPAVVKNSPIESSGSDVEASKSKHKNTPTKPAKVKPEKTKKGAKKEIVPEPSQQSNLYLGEMTANEISLKYNEQRIDKDKIQVGPIVEIEVLGVCKLMSSKKEYLYPTRIKRTKGETVVIISFEDFYTFHIQLMSNFPDEAGSNNCPRIIPPLPPKPLMITEEDAVKLIEIIHNYSQTVLALPSKISRSYLVGNFFKNDSCSYLSAFKRVV